MAKFPLPPSQLSIAAIHHTLPRGTLLWRIYAAGGAFPVRWNDWRFWGPAAGRFDHQPTPASTSTLGIYYTATQVTTAVAEVFQRTRIVNARRDAPWLVGFRTTETVQLLDLTGLWPTRAGASMALTTGPRARAQAWSRTIYDSYPSLDGLWYGSSMHANAPCAALYERAIRALPDAPDFHRALADPVLTPIVARIAGELNYRVII